MHKIIAFVVSQTSQSHTKGEKLPAQVIQSAPHYFEASVPKQFVIKQEKARVGERDAEVTVKLYEPDIVLVETVLAVDDVFAETALSLKDQLLDVCYHTVKQYGGVAEPSEAYTAYLISGYHGDPEQFLKYSDKIAGLLKSEKLTLDEQEINYTLSYQLKYAKNDLVIIDWDGAFVFDTDGEIGEVLELFELANYQLLQYRILDRDLDRRLEKIADVIKRPAPQWRMFKMRAVDRAFREIITLRSQSISEFESLERDIKLIGDWYSARLYDLLSKKFRLEEWRKTLKEKLESLEDVYTIASENLGMSKIQTLEFVQIIAFFVLQIGWFALIILEFFYFTR